MYKTKIAFDVDNTLIDSNNIPRIEVLNLLKAFVNLGCDVIVWSSAGTSYAQDVCSQLSLNHLEISRVRIIDKYSEFVDIAVDDNFENFERKYINCTCLIEV